MPTTTVETYDGKGNLIGSRAVEIPQEQVNADTLQQRARQARAGNASYLAKATPTAAETTAQVKALTRQVNALTRLLLADLDDTTGT